MTLREGCDMITSLLLGINNNSDWREIESSSAEIQDWVKCKYNKWTSVPSPNQALVLWQSISLFICSCLLPSYWTVVVSVLPSPAVISQPVESTHGVSQCLCRIWNCRICTLRKADKTGVDEHLHLLCNDTVAPASRPPRSDLPYHHELFVRSATVWTFFQQTLSDCVDTPRSWRLSVCFSLPADWTFLEFQTPESKTTQFYFNLGQHMSR